MVSSKLPEELVRCSNCTWNGREEAIAHAYYHVGDLVVVRPREETWGSQFPGYKHHMGVWAGKTLQVVLVTSRREYGYSKTLYILDYLPGKEEDIRVGAKGWDLRDHTWLGHWLEPVKESPGVITPWDEEWWELVR